MYVLYKDKVLCWNVKYVCVQKRRISQHHKTLKLTQQS